MTFAIRKIACVGAGVIGASWATNYLLKGYPVVLYDVEYGFLDKAMERIGRNLAFLEEKGVISGRPFARLAGYATGLQAAPPRRDGEHRAVNVIRDYLAEHYADDVSINDLALATGLSPYHLIHVFTGAVGMSPHAYLNQVRVNRAKELLAAGGGLADAALAVGFADQSHFQRWFKKIIGVTPGKYAETL
jgi:AraC-like DNA-binding protein